MKSEQPQTKTQGADKKDRQPEEPESALREVGARLQEAAASLASSHSKLSVEATQLAQGISDNARLNQRSYQHELAYAVQDVERARGAPLNLSDQARTEITRLATQRRGSKMKDCWTYCARPRNCRTKSLLTTSGVSVSKSDRARTRLPRSSFRESRHWKPDLGSAPEPGRNRLHPLQPVKRANLEGEMLRHAVTRPRATATCGPPAMGDLRHRRS